MAFSSSSSILRRRLISQYSSLVINGGKLIFGGAPRRTMCVVSSSSSNYNGKSYSPWLMLPPAYEPDPNDKYDDMNMIFNFYSLAENKLLNFSCEKFGNDDTEAVSSSHGWITVCSTHEFELAFCNPLSGSLIHLPCTTIDSDFLDQSDRIPNKVITSCSPDHHDCRALMSYGPHQRLSFCSPATHDMFWTPICRLFHKSGRQFHKSHFIDDFVPTGGYQDFVYSTTHKLFFCIDKFMNLESWDLQDPDNPKVIQFDTPSFDKDNYPWPARSKEDMDLKSFCHSFTFLVVEEKSGDVFWVRRHVMPHMAPDGSYAGPYVCDLPYMTIGFDVHKYDMEKSALVYMDGSLDGLTFFIGKSHSLALSAAEFPELKPNSIYFTDAHQSLTVTNINDWQTKPKPFGGHDVGIFDYGDRTFSPCYYPCDRQSIQRIFQAPMWFTPSE